MTPTDVNAAPPDDIIICRDVHKWYDGFHAVRGVTTYVKRGEVVIIIGPSGSGKSTFIRTINRLERHERGQIIVDGIPLTDDVRNIDAVRRHIGMVAQSFNPVPPHERAQQHNPGSHQGPQAEQARRHRRSDAPTR